MPEQSDDPTAEQVAADLSAVLGRLMRRLRTASPESGLTPSQRSVLARLDGEGPSTTAALARAEYVRPQSMRLTLGALEEQGLVERTPDPDDGRQSVVSVTDTGRTILAGLRAAKHGWLSEALDAELDGAERRTLADAAALLRRLVER
ncbi:MarR family winged helix-turn-helix transcriptional regulator [Streptomyces sp. AK02-01A]|uniref:MarR family winged helix-turn-helix transcriptional regulator n=1 Tax=Streptomyces sp. AK02-01A TaxID=3028648 RepID=UPI0029A050A2|nr:MarR family transcriptional regulator [Streptomyces sp. AK02-01A]MDX3852453.1 MarR family transcriptional regulator [Streptomyces sp. AK02-01A]